MSNDVSIHLPVEFSLRREDFDLLMERAAMVDDRESGQHQAEYTVEQALTIVFQQDQAWLFETILWGWVVNKPDLFKGVDWVPEGTPEGHVIQEEPV